MAFTTDEKINVLERLANLEAETAAMRRKLDEGSPYVDGSDNVAEGRGIGSKLLLVIIAVAVIVMATGWYRAVPTVFAKVQVSLSQAANPGK
jgi:hypothetical protein